MATTYTLQSKSYDGRYLELVCVQTKNNDSNTSTINWTLSAKGGSVNYYSTGPTTVKINGETVYYKARTAYSTKAFPAAKGSTSGTITVQHNDEGKKSVAVSLATAIYTSTVSTSSGTWALDDIQRGAVLISADFPNDEANPTITFKMVSNALIISARMFASDNTQIAQRITLASLGETRTYTFDLTNAERELLWQKSASSKNAKVYFLMDTTVDNKTYQSNKIEKTVPIANAAPSVSFSIIDINPDTTAAAGNAATIIKGKSTINYTISASPLKKATIVAYGLIHDGKTYNTAKDTIFECKSNVFEYWATDSRGNTTTNTLTHPGFVPYIDVSCSMKAEISLLGETQAAMTFDLKGSYYNGNLGNYTNELWLEARYQENGGSWSNWVPLTEAGTPTFTNNTYAFTQTITLPDYESTYTVECRARDRLSTAYSQQDTKNLIPLFDWSNEDFNFNIPINVKGTVNATGFAINGQEQVSVIEDGESNGWYYRKWSNGVGECWKTLEHSTQISKTWGTMYVGNTLMDRQNYPFTFTSKPVETATLLNGGNAAWIFAESQGNGVNGGYASAIYNVCRPSSVSTAQTFYINLYVRGKWK